MTVHGYIMNRRSRSASNSQRSTPCSSAPTPQYAHDQARSLSVWSQAVLRRTAGALYGLIQWSHGMLFRGLYISHNPSLIPGSFTGVLCPSLFDHPVQIPSIPSPLSQSSPVQKPLLKACPELSHRVSTPLHDSSPLIIAISSRVIPHCCTCWTRPRGHPVRSGPMCSLSLSPPCSHARWGSCDPVHGGGHIQQVTQTCAQ